MPKNKSCVEAIAERQSFYAHHSIITSYYGSHEPMHALVALGPSGRGLGQLETVLFDAALKGQVL